LPIHQQTNTGADAIFVAQAQTGGEAGATVAPDAAKEVEVAPANSGNAMPEIDNEILQQAQELAAAGGPVVAILVMMSVFAIAIMCLKAWQFYSLRIWQRDVARDALNLYRQGRNGAALDRAEQSRAPTAVIVALAIRGISSGNIPEMTVREEVSRAGTQLLETLRSFFRPLEVIATLAPLLGLFGTVLGMIEAFRQLEQAGNKIDPSILSGGIWEALLTTAVGLAIAIPTVAMISWFERIVDGLAHEMENLATQVFTIELSKVTIGHEKKVTSRNVSKKGK
tara:strand:- start:1103 stop:1948 length:846 start_codon:yes stop_codon:yes gene_type:complete